MPSVTHSPGLTEPVPRPPDDLLLERDPELAILGQCFAALCSGSSSGGSVLLSGEAGVGKTTVLRTAARAANRRIDWLWGTCEPMLSPTPLGPLVDWLDRMPPALAAAVRTGRHAAEVLSGVLAMLRDPTQPTVLVVDDAQWADSATLDLLRYLGRRIESTSALLILSYRDDALSTDHPLLGVFSGLPARSCTRMALAPLSRAGVAEMARRAGRSARGLYQVTQGNPFFVTELLAGDPQTLPPSVREAVLARVAPLPPGARDVLELASVSPTPIEVEVLDAVVGDARASIASCTAAGLLALDAGALRFRHELARRAVEASLLPDRAAALHTAVFDALSVRGAAVVRLVHHAAQAGLSGAVLALAPQAAREAAQASAHRQAATLYALALEHAADLPLSEQAALHVAHSLECQHVERHDDAVVSRRTALALHRQLGDGLSEGRDLYELAVIEQYREGPQAGLPYVHAAIDVLEGMDARVDLAVAYAAKAQMHLLDGTSQAASEWGEKALALLEGQKDAEECLAYALNTVASAQLRSQDLPEAWKLLDRSRDIALQHGLESHAARAVPANGQLVPDAPALRRRRESLANGDSPTARPTIWMSIWFRSTSATVTRCSRRAAGMRPMPGLPRRSRRRRSVRLDVNHSTTLQRLIDLRRGRDRSQRYWNELIDGKQAIGVGHWFSPLPVACCEAAWLRGDDAQVRRIATEALELAVTSAEGWRIGQLACWLRRAGGAAAADRASPAGALRARARRRLARCGAGLGRHRLRLPAGARPARR